MMPKQSKFPKWVSVLGIFLLQSLAWIAIAVFIIFFTSFFIQFPSNRADLFSVIEVLFGIVITALAIVASFSVSSQWKDFEKNVRDHTEEVSKIAQEANVNLKKLQEISDTSQSLRDTLNGYQAELKNISERLIDLKDMSEASIDLSKQFNDLKETSNKMLSVVEELGSNHTKLVGEVTESVKKLIPEMVEEQLKVHSLKVNTENATHDDPLVP